MPQTATIKSLPVAFEMLKAMQAEGVEWGEDYRTPARQALAELLEGRMGQLIDQYLPLRKMSRWKQLVALVAAQLTGRQSLRDIEAMLKTQGARLYHLGGGPVPRASLARVNAEQPCTLFEVRFHQLAVAAQKASPGHRFRFKNQLWSFDASLIELSLFPWARFANHKAAVKLHVGFDHGGYLPVFAAVAAPPASDAEFVRRQALPPGSIAVFDKGCVSFALLAELTRRGIFFVTRIKVHNQVRVHAARPVRGKSGVVADETVEILGQAARREGAAAAAARDLRRCRERQTLRVSHQQLPARGAHHRRSLQGALGRSSCSSSGSSRTSGSRASSGRRPTPC